MCSKASVRMHVSMHERHKHAHSTTITGTSRDTSTTGGTSGVVVVVVVVGVGPTTIEARGARCLRAARAKLLPLV